MVRATWLALLLSVWVQLCVRSACANDASFGGSLADLVPVDESRVRMVSEDILLEYKSGSFHVTANYTFENESDEAAKLSVGFPEIVCTGEDGRDCVDAGFRQFRTEVDGERVQLRKGSLSKEHDWAEHLGTVWLFDVTFPVKKQTKIRHTYTVNPGRDVDMNTFTTYVTRSGATWAGTIGEAKFTVRLPVETHTIYDTMGRPRVVGADTGEPYIELQLVKKDWEPQADLEVTFNYGVLNNPRIDPDAALRSGIEEEDECIGILGPRTAEQLRMCRNLVFATAGYPFKKEKFRKYFYGGSPDWKRMRHPHAGVIDDIPQLWRRGFMEFPARPKENYDSAFKIIMEHLSDDLPSRNVAQLGERAKEKVQQSEVQSLSDDLDKVLAKERTYEQQKRQAQADGKAAFEASRKAAVLAREARERAALEEKKQEPGQDSGCGCVVAGSSSSRSSWAWLGAGLFFIAAARRRRLS